MVQMKLKKPFGIPNNLIPTTSPDLLGSAPRSSSAHRRPPMAMAGDADSLQNCVQVGWGPGCT